MVSIVPTQAPPETSKRIVNITAWPTTTGIALLDYLLVKLSSSPVKHAPNARFWLAFSRYIEWLIKFTNMPIHFSQDHIYICSSDLLGESKSQIFDLPIWWNYCLLKSNFRPRKLWNVQPKLKFVWFYVSRRAVHQVWHPPTHVNHAIPRRCLRVLDGVFFISPIPPATCSNFCFKIPINIKHNCLSR